MGDGLSADDPRDVVVMLDGVPAKGRPPAPPSAPKVAQVNQTFQPRVLAVPVGTSVQFPNFDPIFHNVFSYSKAKRFDLGKYGRGKSATVKFDQPGLVKVFCDIHSNMTAFVYVSDTAWVVQPDTAGGFAFRDLPPGTYALRLWHPERGSRTETVSVSESGARLDLQF
jgi:plastocyanin